MGILEKAINTTRPDKIAIPRNSAITRNSDNFCLTDSEKCLEKNKLVIYAIP